MTLVIATGGIDLSVGAVVAISGAVACLQISVARATRTALGAVLTAVGAGAGAVPRCSGVWNGFLVAVLGIQPIIATLILMVAGRGIAQLITERPDHHRDQPAVSSDRRRLLADPAGPDPASPLVIVGLSVAADPAHARSAC